MELFSAIPPGLENLFQRYLVPMMQELSKSRTEVFKLSEMVAGLQQQDNEILQRQEECNACIGRALHNRCNTSQDSRIEEMLIDILERLHRLEENGPGFKIGGEALEKLLPDDSVEVLREIKRVNASWQLRFDELDRRFPPKLEIADEPEKFFIKCIIGDPIDTLAVMSNCGILETLQAAGNGLEDVAAVEFTNKGDPVAPGSNRGKICHLLMECKDYESEIRIRTPGAMDRIRERFDLTRASCMLPQVFELEVKNYYPKGMIERPPNEKETVRLLIREAFPHFTDSTLAAKVSYNRLLLITNDRKVALSLDKTRATINGKLYDISGVRREATPLLCYKCGKPRHFAYNCTFPRKCSRCSEDHDTSTCPNKGKKLQCPNCDKGHAAWYPLCPSTEDERKRSLRHQHLPPAWALANRIPAEEISLAQVQAVTPRDSAAATPGSSAVPPSNRLANPSSSQDSSDPKVPAKRGRGRPPKNPKPVNDPQQPVQKPIEAPPVEAPSIQRDANQQSIKSFFPHKVFSSPTKPSPRSTNDTSAIDVEMGEAPNMDQGPSSSQSSGNEDHNGRIITTDLSPNPDGAVSDPKIKGKGVVRTPKAAPAAVDTESRVKSSQSTGKPTEPTSAGKGRRSRRVKRPKKSKGNSLVSGVDGSPQVLGADLATPPSAKSPSKRARYHSPEAIGGGKVLFANAAPRMASAGATAKE
ncbi:hypothetical protein FGRMN_9894 [Fusarium graminum]|nr:hypothetical protein FGRMN_9894 [Fusarium graminum]